MVAVASITPHIGWPSSVLDRYSSPPHSARIGPAKALTCSRSGSLAASSSPKNPRRAPARAGLWGQPPPPGTAGGARGGGAGGGPPAPPPKGGQPGRPPPPPL